MQRLLIIFALIAIGTLAIFGMSMPNDSMGMVGCPFMTSHSVICDMAPLAHFEMWQSFFHLVINTGALSALLAVVVWVFIQPRATSEFLRPRARPKPEARLGYRFYSYFSWLFSDGILHPKNA